jgi:choline-glycine betaine transporter
MFWETTVMNVEPSPPDQRDREGRKRRRATWVAVAGIVAGLVIAITSALGDMSAKQTILLALPAAILTFGGLIVAMVSDPEAAERRGFRAGLKAGSLRRIWRSVLGRDDDNRP